MVATQRRRQEAIHGDVGGFRARSATLPEHVSAAARVSLPAGWRRGDSAGAVVRRARSPRIAADALEALYRQHVRAVYAFFSYSADRQTAEDLTAATFERVVRSWARFDATRASEQAWIFAIARNVLIDHMRRQRHRVGPSLNAHPEIIDSIACADDPLASAISSETISEWLGGLQPREREVLALRYCAEVPVPEIAACLGITQANVHQISSRALRRLRAAIGVSANGRGAEEVSAAGAAR
jgi:RNA polymerase sigma factor (sigma-70 family)